MSKIDFIINTENNLYIFGIKNNINQSSKYSVLVRNKNNNKLDQYITFENIIWNVN